MCGNSWPRNDLFKKGKLNNIVYNQLILCSTFYCMEMMMCGAGIDRTVSVIAE